MWDILIVEDDDLVRRTLARALSGQGYTVTTANDGQQALDDLERSLRPPKLIIIDLFMPVMDGWRFREQLCAEPRWLNVPVIVFSGSGCDESAAKLAGVEYVAKPFDLQALFGKIQRLIQTSQRRPH